MKKIFFILLLLISYLFLGSSVKAEQINSFNSLITINKDGSINVKEVITYDFGDLEKHGIYRDIPLAYENADGTRHYTSVVVESVANNSAPHPYEVSDNATNMRIKIGDPDALVAGLQHYVITYYVSGVISRYESFDELYWNVTGNGWNVPIENVETIIELPTSSPIMDSQVTCYAGDYGSKDTCTSFDFKFVANSTEDISGAVFHTKDLLANQGMSVVLGFAKNIINIKVEEPLPTIPLWLSIILLIVVFGGLPIFVLIVMILLWYFKGRDENLHDPIIAQYDSPENLPPGVVGTILDERVDKQDVSSEIIYLAIAGYFKINRLESKKFLIKSVDYQLDKLKEADDNLKDYQKTLFNAFFKKGNSVKLSDLKYELFADFKKATKEMYNFVSDNNYGSRSLTVKTALRLS